MALGVLFSPGPRWPHFLLAGLADGRAVRASIYLAPGLLSRGGPVWLPGCEGGAATTQGRLFRPSGILHDASAQGQRYLLLLGAEVGAWAWQVLK